MSDITLFNFEGSQFRVLVDEKGEPWFIAKEVCDVLGYANSRDALATHVDTEDVAKRDALTSGGIQALSAINESGLYSLIVGSRLEGAKRFKRWVTSEVLPSIRKTGSYSRNPVPQQPPVLSAAAEERATILAFSEFVLKHVPTVRPELAMACTARALVASGHMTKPAHEEMRNMLSVDWDKAPSLTPTQIGDKIGGMDAKAVNKLLEAHGYQKKIGKRWEPTEAGLKYAGAVPYQAEHSQHKGVQLKWAPEICDILLALIKKGESTDLGLLT